DHVRTGPESIGSVATKKRRPQAAFRAARRGCVVARSVGALHAHSRGYRRGTTGSPMNGQPNDELLDWQPPPAPAVVSSDLGFTAEPMITGWNRALERPLAVETATLSLQTAV